MFEARFQSFDDRSDRDAAAPRVAALRTELKVRGLDGFIVPRADRYQNEYVPPSDERLAWLTGFTGSAGLAIVLADRAVLFVDGRYQVQVREEVDTAIFTIEHLVDSPPPAWIKTNLPKNAKLGYSPWLHTVDGAERLAKACEAAGGTLIADDDNPIDAVWTDRPEPPLGPVVMHDLRYAGEDAASKLERARADMQAGTADTLMVCDPHAVSWLFNIRGSDVPHTPVVLAFATVPRE
jgi:Xaa-Pro aminopeptidase